METALPRSQLSLLTPVLPGLTLSCCPGEVEVLLSQALQLELVVGGPATLTATGSALPSLSYGGMGGSSAL